jgi:hypothetical protein
VNPQRAITDDDLAMPQGQCIDRSDAVYFGPALAARTSCIIHFALEFRTVDKHRFQRFPVKTQNGKLGQPLIDRALMDG